MCIKRQNTTVIIIIIIITRIILSTTLDKTTCFGQIGMSLVRSHLVSLNTFIGIKSFWQHNSPQVNSASYRNKYQEHFVP